MGIFKIKTKQGQRNLSSLYLIEKKIPRDDLEQMKVQQPDSNPQPQPQQIKIVEKKPKKVKTDDKIEIKSFM